MDSAFFDLVFNGYRRDSLDIPSLRGIQFTAPYFHDGSLPTLASVTDWSDEQYELGLSEGEKADLTAYVKEVSNADEPYEVFDDENTPFRLTWGTHDLHQHARYAHSGARHLLRATLIDTAAVDPAPTRAAWRTPPRSPRSTGWPAS